MARSLSYDTESFCHPRWGKVIDHRSTHIRDLRRVVWVKELPAYIRGASLSRINPILWRALSLPLLFALLHWLSQPLSNCLRVLRFPIRLSSDPFCSACAWMLRKQQQIIFPSVLFQMALGHQISVGERNVVSYSFSELIDTFRQSPRISAGASLLSLSVSSWDLSSNFGAYGLRSQGSAGQIFSSDGPVSSRMLTWHSAAFVNLTRLIGLKTFVLFRKIDEDFGGSASWNTQPICRLSFNKATALLSSVFRLFAWLFLNLPVHERTLIAEITFRLCFVFLTLGWVPITERWICAITFEVLPARQSRWLPRRTATSENPSSRNLFSGLFPSAAQRTRVDIGVVFYTLALIVSETTAVFFRTLSFCLPSPAFSWTSLNATLTPAIIDHCSCFNSPIPGFEISWPEFLINISFHPLVVFGLSGDQSERTQERPPLHPSTHSWPWPRALTGPPASRSTFSVPTITGGHARTGPRWTAPRFSKPIRGPDCTLSWIQVALVSTLDRTEPSHSPRPWMCRHIREPTVLSRVSCRSFRWILSVFTSLACYPRALTHCRR